MRAIRSSGHVLFALAMLAGVLSACAIPSPTPTLPPPTDTAVPAPTATHTPELAPTDTPAPTRPAAAEQEWIYPLFVVYTQITQTGPEIFSLDFMQEPPAVYQLTESEGSAFRPRWSPDLSYLGYIYLPPDETGAQLWILDNLAGEARPAHEGLIADLDDFDWSPAGRYIAYTAPQPDGSERDIYRLDTETGEIANLTADSPVWDSAPAWSPDSRLIAFVSDRAGSGKGLDNIWVMPPDGSNPRNVTNSAWEDVSPSWSPDGSWIIFYRWSVNEEDADGMTAGVWLVRTDGSDEQLLVGMGGLLAGLDPPAWSPDGRYIAYQVGDPGNADIYVLSLEGGEPVNVSNMDGHDYDASWSADSESLIFTHEAEDTIYLYASLPDGSAPNVLLGNGGNGLAEWAPRVPAQ